MPMFASGGAGLASLTSPIRLIRLKWAPTPTRRPMLDMAVDVAVAGDMAYTVNFDYGLRVIDVSDRTKSRQVGVYLPQQRSLA